MADNYLEKRQEELAGRPRSIVRRNHPSLDSLLLRNRSCRGFDPSRRIGEEELKTLVKAGSRAASGMNRQPLRYRIVCGDDCAKVLPLIRLGAALPEEHLPHPGEEPTAYLVVCSSVPEDRTADIDLGFAAQSILLKATEMGLGGVFVLNFRKEALREALSLPLEPLAVIALGKPAERIFLLDAADGDGADLRYYRKDGNHYVPKRSVAQLLI